MDLSIRSDLFQQGIDQFGVGLDQFTVYFAQMQQSSVIVKRMACVLQDKILERIRLWDRTKPFFSRCVITLPLKIAVSRPDAPETPIPFRKLTLAFLNV